MTEQKQNNTNMLLGVIIALLIVIAVLGFFLGKMSANPTTVVTQGGETQVAKDLKVTVIGDTRCSNCPTDQIMGQLKQLPAIAAATFEIKDFADEGVEDYLKENNITALPAFIFNSGFVDVGINPYLSPMTSGEFTLQVGAQFNPFQERSENGFLLLDKEILSQIKSNGYIKGNADAKITWLEYSDIECPFCAKLHNEGTPKAVTDKYGDDINIIFQHFPLDFHANAQVGSEILECLAEQKGSEAFYSVIESSFTDEDSTKKYLLEKAVELGADESLITACLDEKRYTDKVKNQMKTGAENFGVTGTPGNVLINNETGEYEVLSGAYPAASFEAIIDKLLK